MSPDSGFENILFIWPTAMIASPIVSCIDFTAFVNSVKRSKVIGQPRSESFVLD